MGQISRDTQANPLGVRMVCVPQDNVQVLSPALGQLIQFWHLVPHSQGACRVLAKPLVQCEHHVRGVLSVMPELLCRALGETAPAPMWMSLRYFLKIRRVEPETYSGHSAAQQETWPYVLVSCAASVL